eukprot:Pgem_evm1s11043
MIEPSNEDMSISSDSFTSTYSDVITNSSNSNIDCNNNDDSRVKLVWADFCWVVFGTGVDIWASCYQPHFQLRL